MTTVLTYQLPKLRRRAIELYHRDSPFKPKSQQSKTLYRRKDKHPNRDSVS